MPRRALKDILKDLSNRLSITNRYSPEQLDRILSLHKIEAIAEEVDRLAIELDNRLLALETRPDQLKGKKNVKKD